MSYLQLDSRVSFPIPAGPRKNSSSAAVTHSVANGERCSQLKAHASCKCEVYEQLPGVPYR